MTQQKQDPPDVPGQSEGNGHFVLNMLKILFLIAVLTAFWFFFDRWLTGK